VFSKSVEFHVVNI